MRHYFFTGTVAAHPFGVLEASLPAALVAPPCGPHRLAPGKLRAGVTAVALAAVAVAANAHLHTAVGAQEEAGHGLHRLAPSSRTKVDNSVLQMGYS